MIDPRLQRMVELNTWLCATANVGYDQGNRFDFPSYDFTTHSGNEQYPGETDCSALVYYCAKQAGFPIRYGGTMYTGTIVNDLKNIGFKSITWSSSFNQNSLKFGDVLYKNGHVAQWSGKYILEAYGDENGGIRGGRDGDQANETRLSPFRGGWEQILRLPDLVDPIKWPQEPEEGMVEVDFIIEEGSNNIPHQNEQDKYAYRWEKWASGKLVCLISDYFNGAKLNSNNMYRGSCYMTKTLEFPSMQNDGAPKFIEPPFITGFSVRASQGWADDIQFYSIGTEKAGFWVRSINNTIPKFYIDVKLEGYWR